MTRIKGSGPTILKIFLCIAAGSLLAWISLVSAIPNVPYPLDVRWTHLKKTGVPVKIGSEDIPLGSDWTYECRLTENSKYHIYCIGNWTETEEPDTDYDIYVYDEDANLLSTHTESAGLPEQVSNDDNRWYFSPPDTGLYSFRVRNDIMESQNSRNASFMIIQHVEPNTIYRKQMMGRDYYDRPVLSTSIAYEFNVSARPFEVYVDVPPTIDMYEVRIYPMTKLDEGLGNVINGALVPWDPGLHGELQGETVEGYYVQLEPQNHSELMVLDTKTGNLTQYEPLEHGELKYAIGGFNTKAEGYRYPDAFASCESLGQDMKLIYNSSESTLYHLALIAEHGSGKVSFYVKTDFDPPEVELMDPPEKVSSGEPTPLTASVVDESTLKSLYVKFSDDGGETWRYENMTQVSGETYRATLPHFSEGREVEYVVVAVDEVENGVEAEGGFQVLKERPEETTISCSLDKQEVKRNKEVTATGEVTPRGEGIKVVVRFVSQTTSQREETETEADGTYSCTFEPSEAGTWNVLAEVEGDASLEPSQSDLLKFEVIPLTLLEKVQAIFLGALVLMREPPFLYVVYGATSIGAIFAVYKISGRIRESMRKAKGPEK